eukprot:Rhum_TRINITY_DN14405_c16_g1::Rhum_TRINITY_DN14405_c16_g1_i1::g.88214::m.88214
MQLHGVVRPRLAHCCDNLLRVGAHRNAVDADDAHSLHKPRRCCRAANRNFRDTLSLDGHAKKLLREVLLDDNNHIDTRGKVRHRARRLAAGNAGVCIDARGSVQLRSLHVHRQRTPRQRLDIRQKLVAGLLRSRTRRRGWRDAAGSHADNIREPVDLRHREVAGVLGLWGHLLDHSELHEHGQICARVPRLLDGADHILGAAAHRHVVDFFYNHPFLEAGNVRRGIVLHPDDIRTLDRDTDADVRHVLNKEARRPGDSRRAGLAVAGLLQDRRAVLRNPLLQRLLPRVQVQQGTLFPLLHVRAAVRRVESVAALDRIHENPPLSLALAAPQEDLPLLRAHVVPAVVLARLGVVGLSHSVA